MRTAPDLHFASLHLPFSNLPIRSQLAQRIGWNELVSELQGHSFNLTNQLRTIETGDPHAATQTTVVFTRSLPNAANFKKGVTVGPGVWDQPTSTAADCKQLDLLRVFTRRCEETSERIEISQSGQTQHRCYLTVRP